MLRCPGLGRSLLCVCIALASDLASPRSERPGHHGTGCPSCLLPKPVVPGEEESSWLGVVNQAVLMPKDLGF